MSYETNFETLLNNTGLEVIKNNFLFFSMLNDFTGKKAVDLEKGKYFYQINKYLNLYSLIVNHEEQFVFDTLTMFIEQNPLSLSQTNCLIALYPLMTYVYNEKYSLFAKDLCEKLSKNNSKVIKFKNNVSNELEDKKNYSKPLKSKQSTCSKKSKAIPQVINMDIVVAKLTIEATNENQLIIKKGSKKEKRIGMDDDAFSNLIYKDSPRVASLNIKIPRKCFKTLNIQFSGKNITIDFKREKTEKSSINIAAVCNKVNVAGNFKNLNINNSSGSVFYVGVTQNISINNTGQTAIFFEDWQVTKEYSKYNINTNSSGIIELFTSTRPYPVIHTKVKKITTLDAEVLCGCSFLNLHFNSGERILWDSHFLKKYIKNKYF